MLTIHETLERATNTGLIDKALNRLYLHDYFDLLDESKNEYELINNTAAVFFFRGYMLAKREMRKRNK